MSNRNFPTREFLRTFLFPFFFPLSLFGAETSFFTNWNDAGSKTKAESSRRKMVRQFNVFMVTSP